MATIVGTARTATAFGTSAAAEISAAEGHSDGDLLCIIYVIEDQGNPTVNEAGWTHNILVTASAGGDRTIGFSYKFASAESGTYTVDSQQSAATLLRAISFAVNGVDSSDPIDVVTKSSEATNSTTIDPAATTTSATGDVVIAAAGFVQSSTSASAPAGYTKVAQIVAADVGLIVAANEGVGIGVEDPGTFNLIQSSADSVSLTIAIKPSTVAGIAPLAYYYRHLL